MDILNNTLQKKTTNKPDIEQVEREKHEYKLVGKFLRTKGLMLFSYNPMKDKISRLEITTTKTIHLIPDENGKLLTSDISNCSANVDTREIHFESLNFKNAKKRVEKYKLGLIKDLCNLKEPGNGIKFW